MYGFSFWWAAFVIETKDLVHVNQMSMSDDKVVEDVAAVVGVTVS